jgi:hypothetical protein
LRTITCIGTGPSLTPQQVSAARKLGDLYACNDAYKLAPDAALLHACNYQWWDCRWDEVFDLSCRKTTIFEDTAKRYGIEFVPGRWFDGLSEAPMVSYGHSAGFQLLNLAYHAKPDRILLLGYDMRFAPDYDGKAKRIGSGPRHFFGEYPPELQHWPSVKVQSGVHVELVDLYRAVAKQGLVEIVNCSPGSAIDCFPMKDIDAF